jgi:hypothetical protein
VDKIGDVAYLVVHHSASPRSTTYQEIQDWHKGRGWKQIGYHLVIEEDGKLRHGRLLPRLGAHVKGRNRRTIGVCLTGDNTKPGEGWTQNQIERLRELVEAAKVFWPILRVVGHREIVPPGATECPGVDVDDLLRGER